MIPAPSPLSPVSLIDSLRAQVHDRLTPYKALLTDRAEQADLLDFIRSTFPGYTASWHHELIAEKLMAVERGDLKRLIITMPPRHGKSELASVNFPAWYLGRNPNNRIIACSNTARLANRFSRLARNKITHYQWAFPRVRLAADQANIESWDLQGYRGGYIAAGVGGQVTGFGANLIIVDDAVKSAEQADSQTYRDNTWEWYTETLRTRLEPDGAIIVIGTRWNTDDLIGRLTKTDGATWDVLDLPAILPSGDALWPSRWSVAALEDIKREIGSRAWQAQYMGNPAPDEGAIIKRDWFPLFDALPSGVLHTIQSWDTAFKTGDTNDYSVCHTYAVTVYGLHLIGRYKERVDFVDLERAAIAQYEQYKPRTVYIEDKASGQSLGQVLAKKTRIPYQMAPVPKSKVQRVYEATPYLESGRVHLPRWLPGLDDLLGELTAFPYGAHDDDVDAMTQAVLRALGDRTPALQSASYVDDDEQE